MAGWYSLMVSCLPAPAPAPTRPPCIWIWRTMVLVKPEGACLAWLFSNGRKAHMVPLTGVDSTDVWFSPN